MRTDLVVAPFSDAPDVARARSDARVWLWREVNGFDVEDFALVHCLLDGWDPQSPLDPPEWQVNPFTGKTTAKTVFTRYLTAFDEAASAGEVSVLLVPPRLVASLASLSALDTPVLLHVADRWSAEKASEGTSLAADRAASYLEAAASLARAAVERKNELFLWLGP